MSSSEDRLVLERLHQPSDTLAADVVRGLLTRPKWLPPKHLYDALGGALFEQICDLPEYYPTRTEEELLENACDAIVERCRPVHLVELGSGSSRKTRLLLESLGRLCERRASKGEYLPIDLNEALLSESARTLVETFPWLSVRAIVADFERPLCRLPRGPGVLLAFLGGTIGNFEPEQARSLLRALASAVGPGGMLLVGTDMVKDRGRLERAYNDAFGVTASFNLNVLSVMNRKLGADFEPRRFEHLAFYDPSREQIEMHLRSLEEQTVRFRRLGIAVPFERGETLRTEISRKFTPRSAREMLAQGGVRICASWAPSGGDYMLWLAASEHGQGLEGSDVLASPSG